MQTYDVQSIRIAVPADQAFAYIAKPENLPRWTNAFATADLAQARMRTPAGEVEIALKTVTSEAAGAVDWHMTFPDGAVATAFSRVTPDGEGSIYSFVLMAPPVPLEQLEGALEEQKGILAEELRTLKAQLEAI